MDGTSGGKNDVGKISLRELATVWIIQDDALQPEASGSTFTPASFAGCNFLLISRSHCYTIVSKSIVMITRYVAYHKVPVVISRY